MPEPFKIAMVQMQVAGGQKQRNLEHACDCIALAAAGGASLVLLPEALNLGWTHPSSRSQADAIPAGASFQALSTAAQRHSVYVCAGLVEQDQDEIYNSAVIIDRQGRLILQHRKLNELAIGHPYYAQGDRLNVCHTELGTLGLMICADGFARDQVLTRSLGYMGADIILSPSAWAVPAGYDNARDPYGQLWRNSYQPVARDFSMWILSVSNVGWLTAGPWEGWQCIGCSLAVGPQGEVARQGPYGVDAETILYLDITPTPRPARGDAWTTHWEAHTKTSASA